MGYLIFIVCAIVLYIVYRNLLRRSISRQVILYTQIWNVYVPTKQGVLGLNWENLDIENVKKHIRSMGFELRPSVSSNLFSFYLTKNHRVEGDWCAKEYTNEVGFTINKRSDFLYAWLRNKYGEASYKEVGRHQTNYYWNFDGFGMALEYVPLSGRVSVVFRK